MEFKQTGFFFPGNDQLISSYTGIGPISNCGTSELLGDTTLRLDCLGYERSSAAEISQSNFDVQSVQAITPQISQRTHDAHPTQVPDDGCKLVLGLGPTSSAYSYNSYSVGATENREAPPDIIGQQFSLDNDSVMLKLGLPRASEDLLSLHHISTSSQSEPNSFYFPNQHPSSENRVTVPLVDEGSTSAKRASGGFMPSLLLAPRLEFSSKGTAIASPNSHHIHLHSSPEPSPTTDGSACTIISYPTTPGPGSEYRGHHPRKCRFNGCTKGARGASGLCIAHGGGQRCQKPGCNRGAESRTAYCKAHGGGLRCQQLGCTKSAEGKTEYCIAHGGGRRCGDPGCAKAARGKSGLCIKHGGGKRCSVEECTRSAEGQAGLCISHGGGRRCQSSGCNKGAQGSTMYCKAHGGGKRCIFAGCTKGAEGSTPLCKGHGGGKRCLYDGGGICPKSVHGGTDYCVAHGGGKRCAVPGCTKSARGRTDCCVKHGGGKRCRFENCGKSAQGSTDFCKAHGGGKRCSWGHGTCEKFARGKSGLCAAHASLSQEEERIGKGGMIRPGLFSGLVSLSTVGTSVDNDYSSGASAVSDSAKSDNSGSKQLIPPQVLVPLSMKSSSSSVGEDSRGRVNQGITYVVPEGRVHGGGLMSLFGGDLKNAIGGV